MVTYLTEAGNELMTSVIGAESTLHFTKIQFGNGEGWSTNSDDTTELRSEIWAATELQNPIDSAEVDFDDAEDEYSDVVIDEDTGLALIKAQFSNMGNDFDWHVTEIGIFAQDGDDSTTEVLYAVSAVDVTKAAWIPKPDESVASFEFNIYVYIGDVADVTTVIAIDADKASKDDLRRHIEDMDNPHSTDKTQVGLGNVPNVTTNDQRPYYDIASADAGNIDGGTQTNEVGDIEGKETLSTIFGKIKRWIDNFILHRGDYNNPHKVTAAQVNAAPVKHTHAAEDVNSGILGVKFGGTGYSTGAANIFDANNPYNSARGYYYAPGGLLIQWGRLKKAKGEYNITVNLAKSYKDTSYVVLFGTYYGDIPTGAYLSRGADPAWFIPNRNTNSFVMRSDANLSTEYTDWLTIGMA